MNKIKEPKIEINGKNIIINDEDNDIYVEINLPKKGRYFNIYVSNYDNKDIKFHIVFDKFLNVKALNVEKG